MEFVYTHPRKNDCLLIIAAFLEKIKTQYDQTVRFFRMDDEPTLGGKFGALMDKYGITQERTAPYTPDQNGKTERSGGVLTRRARAMRISSHLPADMWPEIYKTAGYVSNRTPRRGLQWRTPHEALFDKKPSLSHMHPYGCRAYPLRPKIPRKNKLEPRAMIGYLVGYDSTNIFRIWVPSRGKVIRTRDVTFDHTRFYDPKELDLAHLLTVPISTIVEVVELSENLPSTTSESIVEEDADDIFETEENQEVEEFADAPEIPKNAENADSAENPPISEQSFEKGPEITQTLTPEATPDRTTDSDLAQGGQIVPEATPNAPSNQSPDQALAPNRRRRRITEAPPDSIAMNTRSRKQAYAVALTTTTDLIPYFSAFAEGTLQEQPGIKWRLHRDSLPAEPRYWQQMLRHRFAKEFQLAAVKEVSELENRGTYQLIEKKNQPKLPLTWVFKYKFDTDGYLQKFKARLCVRGDLQTTNEETYAATLAARTFRAIMAIAAAFDLEIHQFDAINAFVNSKLDDEVICESPEGFRQPGKCWKLLRALYGLKQAPML